MNLPRRLICGLSIAAVLALSGSRTLAEEAASTLDIYFIDVGQGVGNATLLVSPSGETMMLDAGPPRSERRVLHAAEQAKVRQIDYLVNTHFCADHFGATAQRRLIQLDPGQIDAGLSFVRRVVADPQ